MKTITLKEAYNILEDASAIIIDDNVLVYPALTGLEGSDDNEFLYFKWDDEGLGYELTFKEEDNREVKVVGSSMFLYDYDAETEEDHTQITILTTKELENSDDTYDQFGVNTKNSFNTPPKK
jgi:hypothetical protein